MLNNAGLIQVGNGGFAIESTMATIVNSKSGNIVGGNSITATTLILDNAGRIEFDGPGLGRPQRDHGHHHQFRTDPRNVH